MRKAAFSPDHGWSWVILCSAFFCNMIFDGIIYAVGILFSAFKERFQTTDTTTSWIVSVIGAVYHIVGPLAGVIAKRFTCRATTIVGSLITGAGFSMAAYAPNVVMLIVTYAIFGGLGLGMMYVSSYVMVGCYFEKKRSLATGIATCGSGIGMFIIGPVTRILLDQFTWHGAMLFFAGLALNCCVLGATFIPVDHDDGDSKVFDIGLLCDVRFLLFCTSSFAILIGYFVPLMYIVEMAEDRGVSAADASFLLSIIGITNCLGRLLAGWLASHRFIDDLLLYISACVLGGLATMLSSLYLTYAALASYCAAFGCFIACYVSLCPVILVDLLGVEKLPNTFGFLNFSRGIANLIGPPLAGWLVDAQHSHSLAFIFAGLFIVVGGLVCLPLKFMNRCKCKSDRKKPANENITSIETAGVTNVVALEPDDPSQVSDSSTESTWL